VAVEESRYLVLAERMISARGIPLTGSQIIDFANDYQMLPYQSYDTVVKTLQARIAEDIARNRNRSRFIRTGIGTYFLRSLVGKPTIYGEVRWSAHRAPREKPEHPHRILTIPRGSIGRSHFRLGWEEATKILEKGKYDYQSEVGKEYVPVVTAVALNWRKEFFTFKVGIHTHFEDISGKRSVLVRKFLDEFDLDLFETDGTGATSSTARAALPVIAHGRRTRLEAGKLTRREELQFFQVAGVLSKKAVVFSGSTDCLLLISVIDLTNIYEMHPPTHRRLELNQAAWTALDYLEETLDDEDSQHAVLMSEQ
jgi:hypothetical protein